ncbi:MULTISPECIES: nuclear transport factor 2 family protein [Nocardia]|uniref:nuclear transport factor 2 family protein n=1 Tax=Nocardia TaxID=1817 RepID=UPI0018944D59|nr:MULTISPECIES: nuclear transport factor 2 family protein [Nocardia]MBF6352408.1 nuclear transport factor 2 family protein [Nocardia flavorosea]
MDSRTLADRIEISDLLTRYATAVDDKDWPLYRSVFTADAQIDYSTAGGPTGDVDTVVAGLTEQLQLFTRTQHFIANIAVELDGDTAKVRAMFFNPMIVSPGKQFTCGGWYNHELVRTSDGWRSARLVEEAAWFDGLEAAFA